MEANFIRIDKKLLPLSWLYGVAVGARNLLFDMGVLRSRSYATPVIAVGNITVGGTGKTPHVEYLVRLLKERLHVAVLSRGYKRKSRGFVLAAEDTPMRMLGDEPYQMKRKFPGVEVAVDKRRTRGIERLTQGGVTHEEVDVVLLDDAYQHRYVKPGVNILLVDYHRLIIYDRLLPAGRLREPVKGKDRADIVVVTKCPTSLSPMDYRVLTKQMNLYPYQQLFFTTLVYEKPRPLFADGKTLRPVSGTAEDQPLQPGNGTDGDREQLAHLLAGRHVLLLTGIAQPRQMMSDLQPLAASISPLSFGDHHQFSRRDVKHINERFSAMEEPRIIITTEKDAVRLEQVEGLAPEVRAAMYELPIRIAFMLEGEETFNEKIIGYVRKNSRNSILAKGKDDHKSRDSHRAGDRPGTISFRNN